MLGLLVDLRPVNVVFNFLDFFGDSQGSTTSAEKRRKTMLILEWVVLPYIQDAEDPRKSSSLRECFLDHFTNPVEQTPDEE